MPILAADELERLTRDIFAARGVPAEDAGWIATLLVRANLRGHDSHGVIRIPSYVAAMKAGDLNPTPSVAVTLDTPALALVDGDRGFGQVVARRGIALAMRKARDLGLSGSLLTAGEHKGFGLSLAIEILAGILSGTGAAQPTPGPVLNGTLMLCLDPARLLPLEDFHARVTDLLAFVRSAPPAAGSPGVLVPGEPEQRMERERRARGVPVEEETWRQIRECAKEVGVVA